jgi:hypothetical protein
MGKIKTYLLWVLLLLAANTTYAQRWKHRQPVWPKTEGQMMHKLLSTLQTKDTGSFFALFPTFDTLWSMVLHNTNKTPEAQKALERLREHPQILIEFDPLYNHSIVSNFSKVLAKGEDSGISWSNAVMARYELHLAQTSGSLRGYEQVAPERFEGYMFVNDGFNRVTFCIRVAEVQKIKGNFFGGQVLNVLKAKTTDEFLRKEQDERAFYAWLAEHPDTILIDTSAAAIAARTDTAEDAELNITAAKEEENANKRKEVIERRFFEGTLDNEIPIEVYIRYMKQLPGKQQQYDGLYQLGEHKRYLRLEITRNKDGKWIIEDEEGVGTMELTQNGKTFTGSWMNADDNGYDVLLRQTGAPEYKIEKLDEIIDQKLSGKLDEEKMEKIAAAEEKKRLKEAAKQEKRERRKKKKEDKSEESDNVKEKNPGKESDKAKENKEKKDEE